MAFTPGAVAPIAQLARTIEETGFTHLWTELTVTGALVAGAAEAAGAPAIRVLGTDQTIALTSGETHAARRNFAEVRRRLDAGEVRFRVAGRAHTHPTGIPAVAIATFEVLRDGAPKAAR